MYDLNEFLDKEEKNIKTCEKTQEINIDKYIDYLMEQELDDANKRYPQFQSRHEAYALMKEEFEEMKFEITAMKDRLFIEYWWYCRNNKCNNSDNVEYLLDCMASDVINAMKELIQVGAMIKKSKELEKRSD